MLRKCYVCGKDYKGKAGAYESPRNFCSECLHKTFECPVCGGAMRVGKQTCSHKCSAIYNKTTDNLNSRASVEKRRKSLVARIAEDGAEIYAKKVETMIERHGVANGFELNPYRAYGEDNVFYGESGRELARKGTQIKYGVDSYTQTSEWKERMEADGWSGIRKHLKNVKNITKEYIEANFIKPDGSLDVEGGSEYFGYSYDPISASGSFYTVCRKLGVEWSTVRSAEQNDLVEYISSIYSGAVIRDSRSILPNRRELDIYLPDLKIAIEFNGIYWHSEKFTGKKEHQQKQQQCRDLGIRLVMVWEDDWRLRRGVVENHLRAVLGVLTEKVFARKSHFTAVDKLDAEKFYTANHIQGYTRGRHFGLRVGTELVACMTYAVSRGKNAMSIARYATSTHVVGGFSKLLKHSMREVGLTEVVSVGDLCFIDETSNVYLANGFKELYRLPPDYRYANLNTLTVVNKSTFKKDNIAKHFPEIYDSSLTEFEMMDKTKWLRIWDCGKVVYGYSAIE